MASANRGNIRGFTLLHKILLPFFLILSLLGVGATLVSVLLISNALYKTVDERLSAFQEVVFRDIKKQEILLTTYADLLDHTLALLPETEASALPLSLQTALDKAEIVATIYPVNRLETIDNAPLRELLGQAHISGKPRLRYADDLGPAPALSLAVPLRRQQQIRHLLLLQSPMDHVFLTKLSAPFNTKTFLFSSNGDILSGSELNHRPPRLSQADLEQLLNGRRVFKTQSDPLPYRHLFSALPLGTTDVVLVGSELSMTELRSLLKIMATGSVAAITAALLLGGYIYYRLMRQIMAPARELLAATQAVSRGNLDHRIKEFPPDEFGRLGEAFNDMMGRLESLYNEKLNRERELTRAQDEIRHKQIVEQKNREIEQANLELTSHLRELSALFQLNQAMISTLDLGVLFERILQVLQEITHSDTMVLLLYNPGAEELEVRQALGQNAESLQGTVFRLDEGITGLAARNQELIYIHNLATDNRNLNCKDRSLQRGSLVAAPLVSKKRLLGVLNLHKYNVVGFSDNEIKLIQTIVSQAAIAIENAQLYEKTKALSNTDELTGLANRRYFQEILARDVAQARRYGTGFSIVMADIDHFKRYNDTHGHLRGDTVLKKVAAILLQNTRGIDLVARFGGEEFVILLPKTNKEGARAAAEKLRQCVAAETFSGADRSQPGGRLTLSLGVSEFPCDSKDLYELLDLADRALYQAKDRGRNTTVVWDDRSPPLPGLFPAPAAPPV